MPRLVVGGEFNFHSCHVTPRRTFAPAAFAADTKIHRPVGFLAREGILSELPGQSQAQRGGASAGEMLLIAHRAKARAHGAGIELPTMAVVVAHLDGFGETPGPVAPGAGRG